MESPLAARDHAAAASLQIIARNGGAEPADTSLCIPVTDSDPQSLRRFAYAMVCRLIVGILLMLAAAILTGVAAFQGTFDESDWLALPVFAGGLLMIFSNVFFQRRFVRRHIGTRYDDLASWDVAAGPWCVSIEDAATFRKMKVIPEDLGYLALDPSRALAVIEGIRFRYIIFGQDVRRVEQIAGSTTTGTSIDYRIGNGRLRIAVQFDSIWHELKRQTFGANVDALVKRIRDTLYLEDES